MENNWHTHFGVRIYDSKADMEAARGRWTVSVIPEDVLVALLDGKYVEWNDGEYLNVFKAERHGTRRE